jgi:tetratricopeptide (TPR) repeat protein
MSVRAENLLEERRWVEAAQALEAELAAGVAADAEDAHVRAAKHHELGRLWHKTLHRVDRALWHLERAFELHPERTSALDDARALYLSVGDEESTLRLIGWELGRLADTGDRRRRAELLCEWAELLDKGGDAAGAADRLEQALACLPGDAALMERLADLYASGLASSERTAARERAVELFLALSRQARKDDPDAALRLLRRAYGVDPRDGVAFAELVQVLSQGERYEDLDQLYEQHCQRTADPETFAECVLCRAELLSDKLGKRAVARAAYEALLLAEDLSPIHRERTEERLGALYVGDNDYTALCALLVAKLETPLATPTLLATLWQLSTLHAEKLGQRDYAAEFLHRMLSVDPGHPEALARYAAHFQGKRDFRGLCDLCEFNVETAREQNAGTAEIVRRLEELAHVASERLGDTDRALRALRQVLELEPHNTKGVEAVRRLEARMRMWESLVGVLEKEAASAPGPRERADALKRLAQVYRERHVDPRRAIVLYEEALLLLPGDAPSLKALCDLYEREGDDAGLCRTLRSTLDADRDARAKLPPREWPTAQRTERLTLLRRLSGLYETRTSDVDGVVFTTTEILDMLPGDREALGRLERVLQKHGDTEKLEQTLEYHASVATGPAERTKVLLQLARIAERRDDAVLAMTRWEKVLSVSPHEPDALGALGVLYERHGRPALLAKILEKSLKLDAPAGAKDQGDDGSSALLRAVELKRYARLLEQDLGEPQRALPAWRLVLEVLPRDRDAMDALARLYEARCDWRELALLLGRKAELALAQGDRQGAAELTLVRATLLEERLDDLRGATSALETLLGEIDPKHLGAHAALRRLYLSSSDFDAVLRISEREVYLARDPEARLACLLAMGALCRDRGERHWALLCYERILGEVPRHGAALQAAVALYDEVGDTEAHARLLEVLAQEEPVPLEKRRLYLRLAQVWTERLSDAHKGLDWYRRAQREGGDDSTLAELRRAAEKHGFFAELAEVYEDERRRVGPGSPAEDPARFVDLCRELAGILEHRLGLGGRALGVLGAAALCAPGDEGLLGEAERIATACDQRGEWVALLGIFETALAKTTDRAARVRLLERRAWVKSEHLADPGGAEGELLSAFALFPELPHLYDAILRLCARTSHWEHAVTIDTVLFERARDPAARLSLKRRIAKTIEDRLSDLARAFRTHLEAFALAPDDPDTTADLWRLAKAIGTYGATGAKADDSGVVIESTQPARDVTQELTLGDVVVEGGIVETKPARGDSTIPLSIGDLLPQSRPPPGPRPPARFASPWEELAAAYERLPSTDAATKLRWLSRAAEVWERGAGELGRAFDTLARALDLAPAMPEAKDRLRSLASAHDAWDPLVELYLRAAERARSTEQAVGLLLESAGIEARRGRLRAAEELYRRVLGMCPQDTEGRARLEEILRQEERWGELSLSLEERTDPRQSSVAPEDERPGLHWQLAELYADKLAKPYEAITTLERLLATIPDHRAALTRLSELYASVGRWAKVAELLTLRLDSSDQSSEVHDLRRRLAEVYEDGLKLPERAIEVARTLCASAPSDPDAHARLSRLLQTTGKWAELADVLRERIRVCDAPTERARLLVERAEVLLSRLDDADEAVTCLAQARRVPKADDEADDEALWELHYAALVRADRTREAAALLEERIAALEAKAAPDDLAALLLKLASLREPLGDREGARVALEKALVLVPGHPGVLAALSRLARESTHPRAFAELLLSEAASTGDVGTRVAALQQAASTLESRVGDASAAKDAFRQVLALDPKNAQATWSMAALCAKDGELDVAEALLSGRLGEDVPAEERARVLCELATLAQRRGAMDLAAQRLGQALEVQPTCTPAIVARADLLAKDERWEDLATFLAGTLPQLAPPPSAHGAAPASAIRAESDRARADLELLLARAYEKLGRDDEAYALLLAADRARRNDLLTKLALGENRYRARRFREAAQHLGGLAEHPLARQHAAQVAEGLYHAALSEIRALRGERAPVLYEAALRFDPKHTPSLHALAEIERGRGHLPLAADLLERQAHATRDPAERLRLFEDLGDLAVRGLEDRARARACYEAAVAAAVPIGPPHVPVLEKLVREQLGDPLARARTIELLATLAPDSTTQADRLCQAAESYRQGHDLAGARTAALRAVELSPGSERAVALASELLLGGGEHQAAADLLSRALDLLPKKGGELALRAELWRRLGDAKRSLGDRRLAIVAYERAVATDAGARATLAARRALVLLHQAEDERADAVRHHLRALVLAEQEGSEVLALARALARQTAAGPVDEDGARCTFELCACLGVELSASDRAFLDRHPPRILSADESYQASIDERDRTALLVDPDDAPLSEILGVLWEGAGLLFSDAPQALAQRGIVDATRVAAVTTQAAALIYPQVAKVLARGPTVLWSAKTQETDVTVVCASPPLVVLGPRILGTASVTDAELRFVLGRAVEQAHPSRVAAMGLAAGRFAVLVAGLVRASAPTTTWLPDGVSRADADAEATHLQKTLPRHLREKLKALLAAHDPESLDPARYQAACARAADRAGLLACGDINVAMRLVGGATQGRHLVAMAVQERYLDVRARLGIGVR